MCDSKPPPVTDVSVPALIICAICLITLSMLFSISESAFLSMNRLRLRVRRRRGDRLAIRCTKLLSRKEMMINTLLVANDLVNVLLSGILTAAALKLFGPKGVGVTTIITTVLLLIFGEITPKAVCTRHPDPIAYHLSGFVSVVMFILKPVIIIFTAASRLVLRIRGIDIDSQSESFSEEEIKTFIDVGVESGILESGEKNMMNRVFKFADLEAQDIMIPRRQIVSVPLTASFDYILELSERTRFSRFPVYKNDIDDIVGIVYVKDLLFYSGAKEKFSLQSVIRPPIFILGTKNISSVQQILRENHQAMAIVIDEYSGTDGILTKEDIASEIFGTSISEFSKMAYADVIIPSEGNDFIIEGTTRISDLNEILHIKIESEMNETVSGWILERLERMAQPGDVVESDGIKFIVKKMDGLRIASIQVVKNEQGEQQ